MTSCFVLFGFGSLDIDNRNTGFIAIHDLYFTFRKQPQKIFN